MNTETLKQISSNESVCKEAAQEARTIASKAIAESRATTERMNDQVQLDVAKWAGATVKIGQDSVSF